ncbi:FliH/SctL family protein [Paracoccaceae bacterium]|nr:FliH/SctL family protein [Paracoccaceae bacterium]
METEIKEMLPEEDKDNSPLKDKEISRLINVSRDVGYKKQETIPERNLVDFKPTSIKQIALPSTDLPDEPKNLSETGEDDANFKQGKDDVEIAIDKTNNLENVNALEKPAPEETSEVDFTLDKNSKTEGDTTPDLTSEENESAEVENKKESQDSPEPNPINNLAIDKAKKEGIEIGKKQAITDEKNEYQKKMKTLQMLIDKIKQKEEIDRADLIKSLMQAVTYLASERAGQVIDNHPEPFKNKIASFASDIEATSKKMILNLNPNDADVVGNSLKEELVNNEVEIKENSALFRGDFIFQMDTVEIGNLISEQISLQDKQEKETQSPDQQMSRNFDDNKYPEIKNSNDLEDKKTATSEDVENGS